MNPKDKADELYRLFLAENPAKAISPKELEEIILTNTRALCNELIKESYKVDLIYYRDFRKFWQQVPLEMEKLIKWERKKKKGL